ncbi:MAG: GNAT family N-acetyltransferase [Clostridia bacterium]|nr:GNAT family N-acetyltransferase [Clostridia bacterium]
MELIKCTSEHLNTVSNLYEVLVEHLEKTINYPKWTKAYPCRQSVETAINEGSQYACFENGKCVGAVILNDNPGGDYDAGEWQMPLNQGEYMVIHTLGVLPNQSGKGIGGFITKSCIEIAKQSGYKAIRLDAVPENTPAISLYLKNGFTYAGTKDLKRGIEGIPLFNLYELNF